ncbi:hypothetical protein SO802_008740 [Lithocarpus litseifolius]|uniref:Uncharacterized protein n=1 Tax=Lithocarpus litseifolius TaxID=425828 RepID=A0AAW2DCA3_9ROSI
MAIVFPPTTFIAVEPSDAKPIEAKNKLGYKIRTLFKNCNCATGQELSDGKGLYPKFANYLPQCLMEGHCFGFNGEENRDDSSAKHATFLIAPNLCDLSLHICLCFLICLDLAAPSTAGACSSSPNISKLIISSAGKTCACLLKSLVTSTTKNLFYYLPLCLEESHCFGLIEWEIERWKLWKEM